MMLCMVAIFVQLNNIQVVKANSLATNPANPRVQAAGRSQPRGDIISADGVTLASSVLAVSGVYKYRRVYNPNTAVLFSQIVGYDSLKYGNYNGMEAEYNNYLVAHNKPAKSLRDLLTGQTVVDNVTLTINSNLQSQVAQAVDSGAPGQNGAAAVVLDPTTGAIEAMYSNPVFDPNPLVSPDLATETASWTAQLALPGNPLRAGAYNQIYPPGSSFKVVTTSAVLEHRPDLTAMTYPVVSSITLPNTGNPPQILHNYNFEPCGGTLQELLIQSCDADFASVGQLLTAPPLVTQAQQYGFNQRIPLDVPASTVAISNFGTAAAFAAERSRSDEVGHRPGQRGGLGAADGHGGRYGGEWRGGDDPPRDGPDPQLAREPGGFLYPQAVVAGDVEPDRGHPHHLYARGRIQRYRGRNLPSQLERGGQDRNCAGRLGPNLSETTDWLIAFAPNGQSKVAVAVVVPKQAAKQTGAGISGPIVKQILQDILGNQ